MAEKKKPSNSVAISTLVPNSFVVSLGGDDVRVAGNALENAILNMYLASRMRTLLEKHMELYKEDDKILTPREIRDLAAAGRDIAAFSAEVYAASDPITPNTEKKVDQVIDDDIPFSDLSTPPEVKPDEPTGDTPKVDS